MEHKSRSPSWQRVALVVAGVLVGITLLKPAGAHVGGTVAHLWTEHIRPRADDRYVRLSRINNYAPILRAEADSTPIGGSSVADSAPVEVNSVEIEVPRSGFLVISGSVSLTNNEAAATRFYALNAKLDGGNLYGPGGEAVVQLDDFSSQSKSDTLAYTVTVAVAAGAHTISQTLGDVLGSAADFGWSRQNLTVMFIPGPRGGVTATS